MPVLSGAAHGPTNEATGNQRHALILTTGHVIGAEQKPSRPRRRKRDLLTVFVGIATAATIVVTILGVAALLLFASGVVPLSGLQHYVAADLQRRLGPEWHVEASKAAIVRDQGKPKLRIQNVEFRHGSGMRLRAPEAAVGYDPWSILSGTLALKSIEIQRVTLRLRVDERGALILDTGDSQLSWFGGRSMPGGFRSEQVVDELLAALAAPGPLPQLEMLSLTGSRLLLVAPDGVERIALDNAEIRIKQSGSSRDYVFSGDSVSGRKEVAIVHNRAAEGPGEIAIRISALQLDDIEHLMMGRKEPVLSGMPLQGDIRISGDRQQSVTADLWLGRGRIHAPASGGEPLQIDSLALSLRADRVARTVNVNRLDLASGATRLDMSGQISLGEGARWTVSGAASGMLAGDGHDPPQPLAQANLRMEGEGLSSVTITEMILSGPGLNLAGDAHVTQTPDGPAMRATLRIRDSGARGVLAAWPRPVSPIIRAILAERIQTGYITSADLAIDMPPAVFANSLKGELITDESVRVNATARGVRLWIGEGVPPLHDVALTANGTGLTFRAVASSARIELPSNRQITLSEGSFAIADTYAPRPVGRSSFRAVGGVDGLAAIMAVPAFREQAPAQIDPATVRGRFDLRVNVSLPLVSNLKASDVMVQASGPLTGVGADSLFGTEKLEAGNLAVNYDRGALNIRGDARIGGSPAQVDVRQDARGVGEAVVNMTLDQSARERRGLGLGGTVSGPVTLRAVKALGRKLDTPVRVEVDLARAAIEGLLPGWSKPSGRAGRLSFVVRDDDDDGGADLSDIVLDSAPILMRGKASLESNGSITSASLTQLRLSPGDDMRLDFRRDGAVQKLSIRGQVLDSRPFQRMMMAAPPVRRPAERPADLDLDIAIQILTGFNNEALGGATIKLSRRNGEIRQLEIAGRLGRAPVMISQVREGERKLLKIRSEDGGGLMRYVDMYRRAFGGELTVDGTIDGESLIGDISYGGFRVRGEPALRRVLGEQFASQPNLTGDPSLTRQIYTRDSGNDVAFTRMKASFVRTPTRVTIRDAAIWGNEIGVTAQGTIDYGRDRVDVAGTFVPGYLVNNAISNIPIIGLVLGGGGANGGLFAVNFRVGGTTSSPSVTINPLSAIAPGLLRRFVDPLGGVPQGPAAASPPAAARD